MSRMTLTSLRSGRDTVPVDGGELAFEVLAGTSDPVLAVHGVSGHRKLWLWLRRTAPELSLIAPDLRGRADSVEVAGPSCIDRHAKDMIAVLDHLGLPSVHVCGMSMGGFVGVRLAAEFPERVRSLTLVDGGFPMSTPPGLTPQMVPDVFADRLARLEHRWESLDEYLEFFVANTAPMLDPTDPLLRDYLRHDLRDGLVRLSGAALLSDAEDVFFSDNPWESIRVPIRFLHAEWGAGPGLAPGYPPGAVAGFRARTVATRFLPGVDHAGTIMTDTGAAATADLLRQAVA